MADNAFDKLFENQSPTATNTNAFDRLFSVREEEEEEDPFFERSALEIAKIGRAHV